MKLAAPEPFLPLGQFVIEMRASGTRDKIGKWLKKPSCRALGMLDINNKEQAAGRASESEVLSALVLI